MTCTGATLDGSANTLSSPTCRHAHDHHQGDGAERQRAGCLTNQAFIDPDNDIPEGNETNNSDTSETTVASAINLKHHEDRPDRVEPEPGEAVHHHASNDKPEGATDRGDRVRRHGRRSAAGRPDSASVFTARRSNFLCRSPRTRSTSSSCIGDLRGRRYDRKSTITIDVFMTAEGGALARQRGLHRSGGHHRGVDPRETTTARPQRVGGRSRRSRRTCWSASRWTRRTGDAGQALTYTVTISNDGNGDGARAR